MLSLSAHKFQGPKSFGALYIKREFATTSPLSRRIFRMLEERNGPKQCA
uniref:Cysteine desulfurase n=1 Tax=Rhizobium fredii TaxID=380 RepID=Q9EY40_RHIFR|nr:unknown [Sinorhizobium fredii HH103]